MKNPSTILSGTTRIVAATAVVVASFGLVVDDAQARRHGGEGPRMIERLDTDESGTVSEAEFLVGATNKTERRFDRRDKNADGVISEDEFPAARELSAERLAFRECVSAALGTAIGRPTFEDFLESADVDFSGTVDLGEYEAHALAKASARFAELDVDADGEISDIEMEMAKDARKAARQARREAKQACREQLAGYKAPKSIDYVAEMPRHETGKLYKRLLKDKYWEGTGRSI